MAASFPKAAAPVPPLSPVLSEAGLVLRMATSADLPVLRQLYGDFRAFELAVMPWSTEQKRIFLDDQFDHQHLHFTRFFPKADFWMIEQRSALAVPQGVGRLYLDRSTPQWRIIDIGLFAAARGKGLGGKLIAWVQAEATAKSCTGVELHVTDHNPRARALYLRMGFVDNGTAQNNRQPMAWRPTAA